MSPLLRWDELTLDKVTEMVARKTIAGADRTVTQIYLKKGALVPLHHHAGESVVYVLQGVLRVRVGREDMTIREGGVLIIPAGAAHQAESLDDTFVLTVG